MSDKANTEISQANYGIFSILGSGILRSNSKYNVTVCLHDTSNPTTIKLTIKGCSYEQYQNITLQPLIVLNVEFLIPDLNEGNYELVAENAGDAKFRQSKMLNFQANKPLIRIQTDKTVYKQGDSMSFHALFMNECTQPIDWTKSLSISIYTEDDAQYDHKKKLQKQWENIKWKNGVYLGKYKLPDEPIFGRWSISVGDLNGCLALKFFEVDKFTTPKYCLTVETERNVIISDGVINVIVRAKYYDTKDFEGKAIVSLVPKYGWDKDIVLVERTVDFINKAEVQISITVEMLYRNRKTLKVIVAAKDKLYGHKQSVATEIMIHEQKFSIECVEYKPGVPIKLQMAVKDLHGAPVLDKKNVVKMAIEKTLKVNGVKWEWEHSQDAFLNNNGIAVFETALPTDSDMFFHYNSLKFKYLGCEETFICTLADAENERTDGLHLTVLTKSPQLGKPIELRLKCSPKIPYYIYTIIARGKLLISEYVKWPANDDSHVIKFETTFDMVPKVFVFVHYVHDNKLQYVETTITLEKKLKNFLLISAPSEAHIDEDVAIEIKTNPYSCIGLMATNEKNYGDLTIDSILGKLDSSNWMPMKDNVYLNSGILLLTNASQTECAESIKNFQTSHIERDRVFYFDDMTPKDWKTQNRVPKFRNVQEFPENWFFEQTYNLNNESITLQRTVPDIATTWFITGFSLNAETGLGLTTNPTAINTFQPFFINTKLPCSIKKGEQISVPVSIYNNMKQHISVKVIIYNENNEFEFLENGDDERCRFKTILVVANSRDCVYFSICATNVGLITLKIVADCTLAGDTLIRILKVEPEGVTVQKIEHFLLHGTTNEFVKDLDVPTNVVQDSVFIEVSLMGKIFHLDEIDIQSYVCKPHGNEIQNMINFASNINVLRYLECTNKVNQKLSEKVKKFLELTYERAVNNRNKDGSYSINGKKDSCGSPWLTAYAMHSFYQARKYVKVDSQILNEGLTFLAKDQEQNGSFVEEDNLSDESFALTAFVLLAFLENVELTEKFQRTIDRGLDYLMQNIKTIKELKPLAIALYVFQKQKLNIVPEILASLQFMSMNDCDLKWWSEIRKCNEDWQTSNADIEISAYVMLTMLEMENMTQSIVPIAKWLIQQINSCKDLYLTQAFSLNLEALVKFAAELNATGKTNMIVNINALERSKTFAVNEDSTSIKRTLELPLEARQIICSCKGTGVCQVRLAYHYNIAEESCRTTFKLCTRIKPKVDNGKISLYIALKFPASIFMCGSFLSNMTVLEICLPSGFVVTPATVKRIGAIKYIKHVETQSNDTKIVLYLDNVRYTRKHSICLEAKLVHRVSQNKPAAIIIYDFQNRQIRDYYFYEVEESWERLKIDHFEVNRRLENRNCCNKMMQYFMEFIRRFNL